MGQNIAAPLLYFHRVLSLACLLTDFGECCILLSLLQIKLLILYQRPPAFVRRTLTKLFLPVRPPNRKQTIAPPCSSLFSPLLTCFLTLWWLPRKMPCLRFLRANGATSSSSSSRYCNVVFWKIALWIGHFYDRPFTRVRRKGRCDQRWYGRSNGPADDVEPGRRGRWKRAWRGETESGKTETGTDCGRIVAQRLGRSASEASYTM